MYLEVVTAAPTRWRNRAEPAASSFPGEIQMSRKPHLTIVGNQNLRNGRRKKGVRKKPISTEGPNSRRPAKGTARGRTLVMTV